MGYSADAAVPTNCPTVGTSFLDAARAPGALLLYLGCFPSLHLNCRLLWCTGADGTLSATRENRGTWTGVEDLGSPAATVRGIQEFVSRSPFIQAGFNA